LFPIAQSQSQLSFLPIQLKDGSSH
jgi:hypothetical protein